MSARQRKQASTEAPAQDSFLDVVANMVGILIILVMVMGMRAGQSTGLASPDGPPADERPLHAALATEASLRSAILDKSEETERLAVEAARRKQQRDALAVLKAAIERQIAEADGTLDRDTRAQLALRREVADAQATLIAIEHRRQQLESEPAKTIVLANYPTPISRTVHSDEMHFQLRDDCIAYVPLQELVDELQGEVPRVRNAMQHNPEYTDTLGPIDHFRMRYTFRRYDVAPEAAMAAGHAGGMFRLELAEFLPTRPRLGEPIEVAVRQGSELRDRLRVHTPGRTTITLWVYQDSFQHFRMLREMLHEMGFSVAARPLPPGVPISGSPHGSKSAAE